jgi:hypothetical protein
LSRKAHRFTRKTRVMTAEAMAARSARLTATDRLARSFLSLVSLEHLE